MFISCTLVFNCEQLMIFSNASSKFNIPSSHNLLSSKIQKKSKTVNPFIVHLEKKPHYIHDKLLSISTYPEKPKRICCYHISFYKPQKLIFTATVSAISTSLLKHCQGTIITGDVVSPFWIPPKGMKAWVYGRLKIENTENDNTVFVKKNATHAYSSFRIDRSGDFLYTYKHQTSYEKLPNSFVYYNSVKLTDGTVQAIYMIGRKSGYIPPIKNFQVCSKDFYKDESYIAGQCVVANNTTIQKNVFLKQKVKGNYGIMDLVEDGNWTYTITNKTGVNNLLKNNVQLHDQVGVYTKYGTKQFIRVGILNSTKPTTINDTMQEYISDLSNFISKATPSENNISFKQINTNTQKSLTLNPLNITNTLEFTVDPYYRNEKGLADKRTTVNNNLSISFVNLTEEIEDQQSIDNNTHNVTSDIIIKNFPYTKLIYFIPLGIAGFMLLLCVLNLAKSYNRNDDKKSIGQKNQHSFKRTNTTFWNLFCSKKKTSLTALNPQEITLSEETSNNINNSYGCHFVNENDVLIHDTANNIGIKRITLV